MHKLSPTLSAYSLCVTASAVITTSEESELRLRRATRLLRSNNVVHILRKLMVSKQQFIALSMLLFTSSQHLQPAKSGHGGSPAHAFETTE